MSYNFNRLCALRDSVGRAFFVYYAYMHVLLVPSGWDSPWRDGSDTQRRCDGALHQWQTGKYDVVICCGGKFRPKSEMGEAAAQLMKKYLRAHGIPSRAIIVEDRSVDTYENCAFALRILKKTHRKIESITIVSQWQHTLRLQVTFFLAHAHPVRGVYLPSWPSPAEAVRLLYHLFDWRGTGSVARVNKQDRRNAARKATS